MLRGQNFSKVRLEITTYKKRAHKQHSKRMNEEKERKRSNFNKHSKFVCSICLNTRPSLDYTVDRGRRKTISCPICQRLEEKSAAKETIPTIKPIPKSKLDNEDGYNLLNDILISLQNKKMLAKSNSNKALTHKDVAVGPDVVEEIKTKPKLSVSKVFQFSVFEDDKECEENFVVISNCGDRISCHPSIDLIRHKSSSIPQMKMDELRNYFREKTRSKDAIQEVNRMFATVKQAVDNVNDGVQFNRPMVRHGPRVLPVVKTKNFVNTCESDTQTYKKDVCDKCVYTLCCPHCSWSRNKETNAIVCEHCKCHSKILCQHGFEQEPLDCF